MRIPSKLQQAINTYYAFKNITGTGMFRTTEEKESCLKYADKVAAKFGIELVVAPGTFFLAKGKQKAQINGPILPK